MNKKQITSGDLNQAIEIYKQSLVEDGSGGTYPLDVLYWATSAKVDQIKAGRTLQALQDILTPAVMFIVRYRQDKFVTPDMRIKWRGQYFTVITAEVDYVAKEWLVIIGKAQALPER